MSQSSVPFDMTQETFVKPMRDMQNIMTDIVRTAPGAGMMSPLMMHPAAAAAAATALGFGAASHMAGLFFGSVQGAVEASRRFGVPADAFDANAFFRAWDGEWSAAFGKAAVETTGDTARHTADAARALLDDVAQGDVGAGGPVDATMRGSEAVAAGMTARAAEIVETAAEKAVKSVEPVAKATLDRAAPVTPKKASATPARKPAGDPAMAKPVGIDRPAMPDDLKQIAGVGPKLEEVLNRLGIWSFEQIAGWGEKEIAWVDDYLQFRGRISRDDWIGQAKDLAKK